MTREQIKAKEHKPARMALCERCESALRLIYWIVETSRECVEHCGLCGRFGIVRSCELSPKVNHAFRRKNGGGERQRAGR